MSYYQELHPHFPSSLWADWPVPFEKMLGRGAVATRAPGKTPFAASSKLQKNLQLKKYIYVYAYIYMLTQADLSGADFIK